MPLSGSLGVGIANLGGMEAEDLFGLFERDRIVNDVWSRLDLAIGRGITGSSVVSFYLSGSVDGALTGDVGSAYTRFNRVITDVEAYAVVPGPTGSTRVDVQVQQTPGGAFTSIFAGNAFKPVLSSSQGRFLPPPAAYTIVSSSWNAGCLIKVSLDMAAINNASDAWATIVPSMSLGRNRPCVCKMADGRVFVLGGFIGTTGHVTSSAEIFDPRLGTSTSIPNYFNVVENARPILLNDGRILIAGGGNQTAAATPAYSCSYTYDPSLNAWTSYAVMNAKRYWHSTAKLKDGRVLVVGGVTDPGGATSLSSSEVYDPTTNVWGSSSVLSVDIGRRGTIGALSDGRAIYVHGSAVADPNIAGAISDAVEIWDPTTNVWTQKARVGSAMHLDGGSTASDALLARFDGTMTVASGANGDQVFVFGGRDTNGASRLSAMYTVATDKWITGSFHLSVPRAFFAQVEQSVFLRDGRILVGPGFQADLNTACTSSDIVDLVTLTSSVGPIPSTARGATTNVLMDDDSVLVLGGRDTGSNRLATVDMFTPRGSQRGFVVHVHWKPSASYAS